MEVWRRRIDPFAKTFFQTSEWANLLLRHDPSLAPAPLEGDGFCVPLMLKRRLGGITDSYYGMPFMTPAGVVAENSDPGFQWRELFGRLASLRAATVVVCFPPDQIPPRDERFLWEEDTTHVLDLSPGWERIWEDVYHARCRRSVRTAQKEGVTIQEASSETDIYEHWQIMRHNAKKWKLRPLPTHAFIRDVASLPAARVYLARVGSTVVASKLTFVFGQESFYWQGGRAPDESPRGTYSALSSYSIERACQEGCQTYNFASSLGIPGIEEYKESFGAKRIPFTILKQMHPLARFARRIKPT